MELLNSNDVGATLAGNTTTDGVTSPNPGALATAVFDDLVIRRY